MENLLFRSTRLALAIVLLLSAVLTASAGRIVIVSDNAYAGTRTGDPEAALQAFLEGLGHTVIRATGSGNTAQFREPSATVPQRQGFAGIAPLNPDLVIVSRVTDSGSYDAATEITGWNNLTTPILLLSPHLARSSRWKWLNSTTLDEGYLTSLVFTQPTHPIVNGLSTDIYDAPGAPLTRLGTTAAGNGTVIATAPDTDIALATWNAGTEYYSGAAQTPGGRRVLLGGLRYHETDNTRDLVFEDYSENGKLLLARAVEYAMTGAIAPPRPAILNVVPANGTSFHPAASGLNFSVTNTAAIPDSGIVLVLNGVDVSSGLTFTGDAQNRSVSFAGLESNVIYNALITVTNENGGRSMTFAFDTFRAEDTVVIEAEDYNFDPTGECDAPFGSFPTFSGGGFIDNPSPGGYTNKLGSVDIDYHDAASTGQSFVTNSYRWCDSVGTRQSPDAVRQAYTTAMMSEFEVWQVTNGDWMNYSRTFPAGNYEVYLRVSSPTNAALTVSLVTSDASMSNQTTVVLGSFRPAPSGTAYNYARLVDMVSGAPLVVNLSGVQTIRVTAGGVVGDVRLNYMVFLETTNTASVFGPIVTQRSPGEGATGVATNAPVTATIENRLATVNAGSVGLTVNGVNVTSSTVVTPTANGATVSYQPTTAYPFNTVIPVELIYADNLGNSYTNTWSFRTKEADVVVLFVVANPGALNTSDQRIKARLESFGYFVSVIDDDLSQTSHAVGKDLVMVSSTVASGSVAAKFRDVTVPLIHWEQAIQDDLNMTGNVDGTDRGTTSGQTNINIVLSSSVLAGNIPAGLVRVVTNDLGQAFTWGVPLGNPIIVATLAGDASRATIYGYESGAAMGSSFVAPARRVLLFLGDDAYVALTEAGRKLFDSSVSWALRRPVLCVPTLAGTVVNLTFSTELGSSYVVEYKNSLNDSVWTPLQTVPGTGSFVTVNDTTTASTNRFYHVRVQ